MAKPKNPYQRLKEAFADFANKIEYAHTKFMWRYPKTRLSEGWNLSDLAERTSAAEQLGYDVILKNTDQGLEVFYRKKPPARPWEAHL